MIEYFNEDCMVGMARYPDKYFDLAIVDPPYGIGAENGTGDYSKAVVRSGKKWDVVPPPEYFDELIRVSRRQIVWGGNYFTLPISRGWVCWYKTDEVRGRDFSEFELAWHSENIPARHISLKPFIRGGERFHPTQKPVALYKWLLTNYAKPGDKILDTHVGSASSLIACHDMGFDAVGFELDADYYKASKQRLADFMAKPRLAGITEEIRAQQPRLAGITEEIREQIALFNRPDYRKAP
jgi:site-specific DNA-methyltransferase (adenine-specific)